MLIDCHNHTEFSVDAYCTVEDMLKAATKNKIDVFAITDHCEIDKYEEDSLIISVPNSIDAIKTARAGSLIKLLVGIEMGQPLADLQKSDLILDSYDFDYVIGSIHSLDKVGDFYYIDYASLTNDKIAEILRAYYEQLYDLAMWNKFDSVAHITYPYRYIFGSKSKRDINIDISQFNDVVSEFFKLIIKNQKAIENNSSSFTRSKEDYELNYKYMKLYYDLGGRLVTIGSDAHTLEAVGNGIKESYAMLKKIGFDEVVYFEKRKPIKVSI